MVLPRRFPGKRCCAFVLRPMTERSKERHRILDPAHDWAFGHHRFAALGLVGREPVSADPMQHNRQPGAGEARTDPSLSIDGREPPNDLQDPGRGVSEHGRRTSISQARQQRSVRSMSGQQHAGSDLHRLVQERRTGDGQRPLVLVRLLWQRLVPKCPGVMLDRATSRAVLCTRGAGTSDHQQARPRRR
jgi:hypothetical protein